MVMVLSFGSGARFALTVCVAVFFFFRHGFMPLQGMEVPIMVLQSKVFLVCMLQKFAPVVSKKKTFIRRVRSQVKEFGKSIRSIPPELGRSIRGSASFRRGEVERSKYDEGVDSFRRGKQEAENGLSRSFHAPGSRAFTTAGPPMSGDEELCELPPPPDPPQPDFMAHFTKTPFPEPRRVIKIRPRVMDFQSESLEI